MNLHKNDIRRILLIILTMMMAAMLLALCGCNAMSNTTRTKDQKSTLKESGFFDQSREDTGRPLNVVASGNAQVNIGDKPLEVDSSTNTTKKISSDSFMDVKISEVVYNPYTWILTGLGLLLVVMAFKKFLGTSIGKAIESVGTKSIRVLEDMVSNVNVGTAEHTKLTEAINHIRRQNER